MTGIDAGGSVWKSHVAPPGAEGGAELPGMGDEDRDRMEVEGAEGAQAEGVDIEGMDVGDIVPGAGDLDIAAGAGDLDIAVSDLADAAEGIDMEVGEGIGEEGDKKVDQTTGRKDFKNALIDTAKDLKGLSKGRQLGGGLAIGFAAVLGFAAWGLGKVGQKGIGSLLEALALLLVAYAIVQGNIKADETAAGKETAAHIGNASKNGLALLVSILPSALASGTLALAEKLTGTAQNRAAIGHAQEYVDDFREQYGKTVKERDEAEAADAQRKHEAKLEGERRAEEKIGKADKPDAADGAATPTGVSVEQSEVAQSIGGSEGRSRSATESSATSDASSVTSSPSDSSDDATEEGDTDAGRRRAGTV